MSFFLVPLCRISFFYSHVLVMIETIPLYICHDLIMIDKNVC